MFVMLCHAHDAQHAQLLLGVLANEGIEAHVHQNQLVGDLPEGIVGSGSPPWIEVKQEDFKRAGQILRAIEKADA